MWKLLNRLFGWDYVAWKNSCNSGIARVFVDGHGEPFCWPYNMLAVLEHINKPTGSYRFTWLTCSSDKYKKTAASTSINNENT